jgi:hypothetical protein
MTESGLRKRPTSSAVPTKGQKGATGHSNNGNDDSEPEPDASTTLTSTTAATDSPSTHRNPISVIFSVLLHLAAISLIMSPSLDLASRRAWLHFRMLSVSLMVGHATFSLLSCVE